jgi:nucleoside-diphosphate-sugar epimerase
MSRPSVLITGGTGFLGSHLIEFLIDFGYEVFAVKRPSSKLGRVEGLANKVHFISTDFAEIENCFKTNQIEAVIHTATCYGRHQEAADHIYEANLNFPLKLLELAVGHGVRKFINTDTPIKPNVNFHALSKFQFVEAAKLLKKDQLKFINLKLYHVFGPHGNPDLFVPFIIKACLTNQPQIDLTAGEQKRDFIYIKDVVAAYKVLLQVNENQLESFTSFDLGLGKGLSIKEFVGLLATLSGSTSRISYGAIPTQISEQDYVADITRLLSLGWSPAYSIEQGILETLQLERQFK